MFIPVLDFYPSRIPDSITATNDSRRGKYIVALPMSQFTKNYCTFYPKNCHLALKNMGLRSGIRKKPILDSGSGSAALDGTVVSCCVHYFLHLENTASYGMVHRVNLSRHNVSAVKPSYCLYNVSARYRPSQQFARRNVNVTVHNMSAVMAYCD